MSSDVASYAWLVTNQKQEHGGYTLSDDTAFTQKQTEQSADLRRRPALKSTYSTYWLLKLRVSEFTLNVAGTTVFFPWGVYWSRDGSAHICLCQPFFDPMNMYVVSHQHPGDPSLLPDLQQLSLDCSVSVSFTSVGLTKTVLSLLWLFS